MDSYVYSLLCKFVRANEKSFDPKKLKVIENDGNPMFSYEGNIYSHFEGPFDRKMRLYREHPEEFWPKPENLNSSISRSEDTEEKKDS